jgi:hypothetical protein
VTPRAHKPYCDLCGVPEGRHEHDCPRSSLYDTDRDDWREHYPHEARLLDSKPAHRRGDLFVLAGFLAVFVLFVVWGVWLWARSRGAI